MPRLLDLHCEPPVRGAPHLTQALIQQYLKEVPQWLLSTSHAALQREFHFRNYYETMAFVNAVAWVAHGQDHHPDLEVSYNRCKVVYTTHAVGGLSLNDFICAAHIDALQN